MTGIAGLKSPEMTGGVGTQCSPTCGRYAPMHHCRFSSRRWDKYPCTIQMERLVSPADHRNTTGELDPSIHSHHGESQSLDRFQRH